MYPVGPAAKLACSTACGFQQRKSVDPAAFDLSSLKCKGRASKAAWAGMLFTHTKEEEEAKAYPKALQQQAMVIVRLHCHLASIVDVVHHRSSCDVCRAIQTCCLARPCNDTATCSGRG